MAATAIETSRAEAIADPSLMDNAVMRAEGAARVQHAGQPPAAIEAGARAAGGSVIAGVIGDRLARNDPMGVTLFQRYVDRLDPRDRRTLGAAAETLSNAVEATVWLRDRSATLRTPAPTGDAAIDAVNAASASAAGPPSVTWSSGTLLDHDGITGTGKSLDEIDERRRTLTVLNQQEFAANPARLRANQAAIDADTARRRATVRAESDSLYAELRRHLTTGGPGGGPAVTPPSATIMSRLTDAQQDAVTAQVNGAIEGRKTRTDPQTWYAIRQGLTGADATERQRWASKNLVQFTGRLSDEDFATLEKLQTTVRNNDGGAEQNRLQAITRMANDALRSAGIDPTPRPDAPLDGYAAQAASFHRALQDELTAFESKGRKPTEAEAYDIVNGLKDTAIRRLEVSNPRASPTEASDGGEGDGQWADANIVRVAGGDKEKDGKRPRLPGSANRPSLDERPPLKQIDPLAIPGGGGGGFGLTRLPRPSPSAGGTAPKPTQSTQPSTSGQEKTPFAAGGDVSPKASSGEEGAGPSIAGNPRTTLPTNEARISHMFRVSPKGGHLSDTPRNRQLLVDMANDQSALLGTDGHGNAWYGKKLPDGTQVWAQVRGSVIINGGLNQTEKTFHSLTGLSAPEIPNSIKSP